MLDVTLAKDSESMSSFGNNIFLLLGSNKRLMEEHVNAYLTYMLNPGANHGFGSQLLSQLFSAIDLDLDGDISISVKNEDDLKRKRIDTTIEIQCKNGSKVKKYIVGIEVKVSDSSAIGIKNTDNWRSQLVTYADLLKEKYRDHEIHLCFLAADGDEAEKRFNELEAYLEPTREAAACTKAHRLYWRNSIPTIKGQSRISLCNMFESLESKESNDFVEKHRNYFIEYLKQKISDRAENKVELAKLKEQKLEIRIADGDLFWTEVSSYISELNQEIEFGLVDSNSDKRFEILLVKNVLHEHCFYTRIYRALNSESINFMFSFETPMPETIEFRVGSDNYSIGKFKEHVDRWLVPKGSSTSLAKGLPQFLKKLDSNEASL